MNKKLREKIKNKYQGRCSYCGCELGSKFHIDHMNPVIRYKSLVSGGWQVLEDGSSYYIEPSYENKMVYPDRDNEENLAPACVSCNIYKGSADIEQFRWKIQKSTMSLDNSSTQYKFAKKYGLVIETRQPVVFHFELIQFAQDFYKEHGEVMSKLAKE